MIFTILILSLVMGTSHAFADHMEVIIKSTTGSSVPGCEVTNGCFIPYITTVDLGGKVIFSNTDSAAHTFTAGTSANGPDRKFDSSLVMTGGSYQWIADVKGNVPYFCMVHPWMTGKIIVENSSNESNSKCGAGTVFNYASNSCVLITQPPTKNIEVEKEIFEFDIRRDKYSAKEPIFIDGYVKYIKYPSHINIKISEVGGKLVENVYVLPGKDNYFFYNTKSLPSWEIPSTYSVKVTYDNKSDVKYFDLVINNKDYNPQSVDSLQSKLGKLKIDNHKFQQKIQELEELLVQKEIEMRNMFCYKLPT